MSAVLYKESVLRLCRVDKFRSTYREDLYPDEEFWLKSLDAVKHVYTTAILPELLGKFYTCPTFNCKQVHL